MLPYQQRVVAEALDLKERLDRLRAFFGTAIFVNLPADERRRMQDQSIHMEDYHDVLKARIEAFTS